MRIAYVLGSSAGGTVRHVWMLADGLAARGMAVSVYGPAETWGAVTRPAAASAEAPATAAGGRAPRPDAAAGPRFTPVEIAARPRPGRDLAAVRRLRGLLAASRPDVVHAHGLRAGALAAIALGPRAARPRAGVPRPGRPGAGVPHPGRANARVPRPGRPGLVVTVHNAPPAGVVSAAVYRLLERIVARRADAVLCVSADLEARMRGLGARGVARALVPAPPAPPAPPGSRAATRAGLVPGDAPLVLAVARLAPQKGLGTLIDAAARWRGHDPGPALLIAGSGPLAGSLARRAEAAGASVRFLGQRDDVPALLAAADVVVVPSEWEGQPLIVQEALRAGRPLVASRAGGIPELTGEAAALLVPPGDPAALAAAVLSVLDDPGLAARLSEAAARRAAALPAQADALDAAVAAYGSLGGATSG